MDVNEALKLLESRLDSSAPYAEKANRNLFSDIPREYFAAAFVKLIAPSVAEETGSTDIQVMSLCIEHHTLMLQSILGALVAGYSFALHDINKEEPDNMPITTLRQRMDEISTDQLMSDPIIKQIILEKLQAPNVFDRFLDKPQTGTKA